MYCGRIIHGCHFFRYSALVFIFLTIILKCSLERPDEKRLGNDLVADVASFEHDLCEDLEHISFVHFDFGQLVDWSFIPLVDGV